MIQVNERITWPTVCIFGDSIVWGGSDEDGGGWADRLKNDWAHSDSKASVHPLGVSGDRLVEITRRFDAEAAARNPRAIVIAVGANDLTWATHPATDPSQFEAQFIELLEKALEYTKNVMVLGLLNVDESSGDHGVKNAEAEVYNIIINRVAAASGSQFLNLFGLLGVSQFSDGIHPNASGHFQIYQAVKTELEHRGWDR